MGGPRSTERGAFTPLIGGGALVLGVLVLGGVTVGRLTLVKADTQRAADAAALAAAQLIRDRGMPFDAAARAAAEAAGNGNTDFPVAYVWDVRETGDSVDIEVTATVRVDAPALVGGARDVAASATAAVAQSRFDEAERRLPKLVLVLDYSGSMLSPFVSGGVKIAVLEASVAGLLAEDLLIEYGAVFYSTSVFRQVPISAGAPAQIIDIMNAFGAGGNTNTAAGLARAGNLLTATPDTGYHVLLVSDGAPCCASSSVSAARAAATALWNRGVTIFTLEIRDSPPIPALAAFMTDVAGSPTSRRDPAFHFVASSAADLVAQFRNIVARIVCAVGPLAPAPADPGSLRVYLASGGAERPVAAVPAGGDLAAFRTEERFQYDPAEQKVRLTEAACNAVIDAGDDIVVRFDRPTLVD